ncbi:MAG TPA: UDP-glucose 6-dehydrogenase, partial [Methylophilaceae bacterium]|nr:UDP-glucose 6-dehydrogenase [Methylophilaceae bacterium]
FLREGSAVNDFLKPERIIIGTNSEYAKTTLKALYKPLCRKSDKIIFMSSESAELTKYSANAFLATKISFINEIAEIAEIIGADMHEIRQGIGTDSRIGKDFLYAGLGYGEIGRASCRERV